MDLPESVKIIDVRPAVEFGICHLPGSISALWFHSSEHRRLIALALDIPLRELMASPSKYLPPSDSSTIETIMVCRLGNDSQIAADVLSEANGANRKNDTFADLIGGLRSWSRDVDANFPVY